MSELGDPAPRHHGQHEDQTSAPGEGHPLEVRESAGTAEKNNNVCPQQSGSSCVSRSTTVEPTGGQTNQGVPTLENDGQVGLERISSDVNDNVVPQSDSNPTTRDIQNNSVEAVSSMASTEQDSQITGSTGRVSEAPAPILSPPAQPQSLEITVSNDHPERQTDPPPDIPSIVVDGSSEATVPLNSRPSRGDTTHLAAVRVSRHHPPSGMASPSGGGSASKTSRQQQRAAWTASRGRSDSVEEGRQYSTEDEASDWEGPVDVELEESPVDRAQTHTSKVSWSTVKALARWMPTGRPKHPWTQMAGHQGSFLSGPKGSVLKVLVPREERNLKQLMADTHLRHHVPVFHGTVSKDGLSYVRLQDLLSEFSSPCVMDIKMGVRTYLEEELHKARKKPTLRKDLYQKMISIDPEAPTEEERQQSAIIKPRYMKFRDDMSSTSSLGFRIEGIKTLSGASKDYKNTRTREEVREALTAFVGDNTSVLEKYTSKLESISSSQTSSQFFQSHEMVGSSLLFVHDARGQAGVWMIDFAKCCPLPTTVSVDHLSPWIPGNYEDGYLFGMDNLKSIFKDVEASGQHE